jgi:hypothetical protein
MKILITGKRDKLWKVVGGALSGQPKVRAVIQPVGSSLIETLRSTPLDAVFYTLSSEADIELLRWIGSINPSLPVIALATQADFGRLGRLVREDGSAQLVALSSLEPQQIRKTIFGVPLGKPGGAGSTSAAQRQISDDLHSIRSTLTAILGTAEIALKRSTPPAQIRKQIKEIPRGVLEIEKILRRLDRTIKSRPPAPKRDH